MRPSLTRINKIDVAELKMLKKRIDIATAVTIFFIAILVVRLWQVLGHIVCCLVLQENSTNAFEGKRQVCASAM